MNRVQKLFKEKSSGILSIFFTAGYPQLDSAIEIATGLEAAGVDLIEIGIPFSDPVADGPVIQESNKVALQNGMNLKLLLQQAKAIRQQVSLPIILMGYINPILQYGVEKFCSDCQDAGVDGLIIPDLPADVYRNEYKGFFQKAELSNILLISPTTSSERIRIIDDISDSFIYAVSASSITGTRNEFSEEQVNYFQKLKTMKLKNPCLIGFGISNHKTFSTACEYSAGAIVGSAFVSMLKNSKNITEDVKMFVKNLKG